MCSNCAGDYENPDATVALDDLRELKQLCESAAVTYFHVNLSQTINETMGEGDPLHLILQDVFYRRKFRLASRAL